jgi:hypothetical protein
MSDGKRIFDWDGSTLLAPGEYAHHPNGDWFGCTPNDHLATLTAHSVVEHEDGTITVAPSILVRGIVSGIGFVPYMEQHHEGELWHGFLERGVWREV